MGELWVTAQEYLPALQRHWIDYLRVDVSHAEGITGLMKASTLADAYQVSMAFHQSSDISPLAHSANMHIDAAIVNFGIQEFCNRILGRGRFLPGDTVIPTVVSRWNAYRVSESGSMGESAARFPYKESYMPLLQDRDGAVHNW